MNKYGEIARIKHNGITYILAAEKVQSSYSIDDPFIPNLLFFRTKKTSRKVFSKNLEKHKRAYGLSDNIFSIGLIRKIISGYIQYFDQVKPKYICYIPYDEGYEKRHKYYGMILKGLGYKYLGKCRDYYYYEKETT